jgi:DUF4097 and DUF4098 domain-containing protein YvlB
MSIRPRVALVAPVVLTAAVLLGAAPAPRSRLERSAPLPSGTRFVLDADEGSVVVRGSTRADVRVVVTSSAEDLESKVKVEIKEEAGQVRLVSRRKKTSGSSWFGLFGGRDNLSLRFEVELPARSPVSVDTAGGHLEASGLRAEASLDTSGGSIKVLDHQGRLQADTSGGHIRLERIRGDAEVHTSGGRIEARDVDGDLSAETSGGSIEIADVSGDLRAETSGGSIRIRGAGGRVHAETSGGSVDASFKAGNARGGVLDSSAGSVRVALDPAVDLSIDASSSGGSVRSELPLKGGTQSRSALKGTLGRGGNLLRVHTSAGSVEIGPL